MTPEESFLAAILESPDDDTPRLVYADWLEERGDPLAAPLRRSPEAARLAASLKTATELPRTSIERHAASGRFNVLSALALLLERGEGLIHNRKWPRIVAATREHLDRVLALTPGAAAVECLLTIPRSPNKDRFLASVLADRQPREVLLSLFERPNGGDRHTELLACVIQEMLVRGAELSGVQTVECFQEILRARGHPLAELPLHLLDLEGNLSLWVPRYGTQGSNWGRISEADREGRVPLLVNPYPVSIPYRESNESVVAERMAAAVRSWQEQSNGEIECRIYHLEVALGRESISVNLLLSLELEALQGADAQDVRAEFVPPDQALNTLFSAACNGGAYNSGLAGAYGRLAAWRSLAGLAGATEATAEQVCDLAHRCTWISFTTSGGWFNQIAWDLGLLAIRPDGRSLAVLAATDTD